MTTVHLSLLDSVRIASPCSVRWDQMTPVGETPGTRHCHLCSLTVHNLSEMTRAEAEAFVASRAGTGRVCTAFYRRADGTILTRDCPVGLRALRAKAVRGIARIAAAVVLVGSAVVVGRSRMSAERTSLTCAAPFSTLADLLHLRSPRQQVRQVAGEMYIAPPSAPAAPPLQAGN